ncbi:MAG: tetratricopeptide repeat protein [Taibaiella sp.]|nr:tetratricopeptide repeat protein [Taibaiella sp.]
MESKASIAPKEETDNINATYQKAVLALKENPDDMKQYITLGTVYILEGRITGNNTYYGNAAVNVLDRVINGQNKSDDLLFQAYSLKSTVLLNMHQFKDALDVAEKGRAISDFNSGIYGALVDANVELGHYDTAVKDCDKMINIRPDLRSYSRASYLRQIYGDNRGAIDAMKMAVESGLPGAESTEWARVTLGDLYLNIGNLDSANITYRTALVYRPNYPVAELGMAKVARARKNYDEAIEHTKAAIKLQSEAAFVTYLGDLYELKGDTGKAKEVRSDVIRLMEDGEKDQKDVLVKHNANRELAMAYLNDNNIAKALEYDQKDLNMRPDNIDANELAAWIYYRKGDYTNAKMHADKMLKTNTKNANSLYKAGVIYISAGDTVKGNQLIAEAQSINPYIDQLIINESKQRAVVQR